MSSQINRPTGYGYQGSNRECTLCGHSEMHHYERLCSECGPCSFSARVLTPEEKRIMKEAQQERGKIVYVGEAWEDDFRRDVERMKIEGIDK